MPKLTRAQRKMIIEHAAQECAQDLPMEDATDFWGKYDVVMEEHWTKLMLALGTAYRAPHGAGWYSLVEFTRCADELDRDPGGHLYAMGIENTEEMRDYWKDHYNSTIGLEIDNISYRAS